MRTWLHSTLKVATYVFLAFAAFCAYELYYYPLSDRWYVFSKLDTPSGQFIVGGESEGPGPLGGWGMCLFWKRPNEYWACYYLNHDEPYWANVKIFEKGNHVIVENGGQIVSELDTQTMLNYLSRSKDSRKPMSVFTDDPFLSNGGQQIDLESPQGRAAWPHIKK